MLKTFSVKNKSDLIRKQEHFLERKLKYQLVEFGIIVEFENIAHYGIRNIKN
jgi:hypothetical protein